MKAKDQQFLIECVCNELIPMIMTEWGLDELEAIDLLYKSNTFRKLENPNTGLYYQGSVYIFEFLKEEFDILPPLK